MKWVIIIFYFVIGFTSLYYSIKLIRLYRKVKSWPKLKAKVMNKAVVDKKLSQASRASKTISVEYSYKMNGIEYKNNTVFLVGLIKGERGFLPDAAQKFLNKIEDEIEVYADPTNPNTSVIFCDGIVMYSIVLLAGIIMILVGSVKLLTI